MRHYWFLAMIQNDRQKQLYDLDRYNKRKETTKKCVTGFVMNELNQLLLVNTNTLYP